MRRNRRGFTLVEILIAMGVIVVLASMVFLAFKHVSRSAKQNTTVVVLQNLRGMLTEFEHSGGRLSDLDAYYGTYPYGMLPAMIPPPPPTGPFPPNSVADGGNARFGEATVRTQRVMRRLAAVPSVKAMIDNLGTDSQMYVEYQSGVNYVVGDELVVPKGGGQRDNYVCTSATTAAPPGSGWALSDRHTPVLQDAERHPIIFVPSHGLRYVNLGDQGSVDAAGREKYSQEGAQIVAPGAKPNPAPPPAPPLLGVRPFFASAGADGDFSKGDDNHYSFEE